MDSSTTRTETLDAFTVVGLELVCGPKDSAGIPALWDRFFARIKELEGYQDFYGVCLPRTDGAEGFRYLACITPGADTEVPAGMLKVEVPPAKYAVYPFHDKVEEMKQAFAEIYGKLLPAAGLKPAASDQCLEYYPPDCWDEETKKIKADLFIAIE